MSFDPFSMVTGGTFNTLGVSNKKGKPQELSHASLFLIEGDITTDEG
jgi:hypothetical protein